MAEFKGNAYAISEVVKGLHVVDLHPTKIYCNCCVEKVERIEFLNASFVPERTCRYEPTNRCTHACTSCGREVETLHLGYNYCPNCGAKVIANEMRKNG